MITPDWLMNRGETPSIQHHHHHPSTTDTTATITSITTTAIRHRHPIHHINNHHYPLATLGKSGNWIIFSGDHQHLSVLPVDSFGESG